MAAGTAPSGTPPQDARRRLALLVRVAASAGEFSPRLSEAVDHATDAEVRIMSDLVDRGMSIPDLVSVLQGAHVIVGDDDLYERWIFPTSRRRMSSHHRTVDKSRTPDYGLDGPLVRESLHGKASIGTWVQLERTKATFQWGRLPTWSDVVHIRDYVLYRLTGKNVGPWGLSAHVDTRPMLLRPPQATPGRAAMRALATFSRRRADLSMDADEQARWGDLLTPEVAPVGPAGDMFGPPTPQGPADLLPSRPHEPDLGLGLFGSLALVRATAPLRRSALALVSAPTAPVGLAAPEGPVEAVEVPLRDAATIRVGAQLLPWSGNRPVFIGIEEDRA